MRGHLLLPGSSLVQAFQSAPPRILFLTWCRGFPIHPESLASGPLATPLLTSLGHTTLGAWLSPLQPQPSTLTRES